MLTHTYIDNYLEHKVYYTPFKYTSTMILKIGRIFKLRRVHRCIIIYLEFRIFYTYKRFHRLKIINLIKYVLLA